MNKIGAGIIAGLIAGVVFGMMMQTMMAPTPNGGQMPMMAMVAMVVHSKSIATGWLYHLFNSAVIGGIFGGLFGALIAGSYGKGFGWGIFYGFIWWILGGLVLMPILLGMSAFAPLTMPMMHKVAMGSLMGHLIFGMILGLVSVGLLKGSPQRLETASRK